MPTNPPKRQPDSAVIAWLLDSDPSIRWQVMRDLQDRPLRSWQREQARVATEGWGAQLLAHVDDSGRWTQRFYGKKWISTTYSMVLLRQLGLPADDSRVKASCRIFLDEGLSDDGGINVAPSQIERALPTVGGAIPPYQLVLTRPRGVDQLEVQIEVTPAVFRDRIGALEELQTTAARQIEQALGLRVPVSLVGYPARGGDPQVLDSVQTGSDQVRDLRHEDERTYSDDEHCAGSTGEHRRCNTLGFFMFAAILFLAVLQPGLPYWPIQFLVGFGFLFSLYFLYVQIFVLRALCTWCVISFLVFSTMAWAVFLR